MYNFTFQSIGWSIGNFRLFFAFFGDPQWYFFIEETGSKITARQEELSLVYDSEPLAR